MHVTWSLIARYSPASSAFSKDTGRAPSHFSITIFFAAGAQGGGKQEKKVQKVRLPARQ